MTWPADLLLLRLLVGDRARRLDGAAEVGAVVRDDREARLAVELAVEADEGRAPADLALVGVLEEGDDAPFALGEVVDRADVDVRVLGTGEGGQHGEPERRHRDEPADDRADAERRGLEELRAREALVLQRLGLVREPPARRARRSSSGSGSARVSVPRSRIQSQPKATAMIAPSRTIHQPTTRPVRRTATPIANPTGQRLGGGTCGCPPRARQYRAAPPSADPSISGGVAVNAATTVARWRAARPRSADASRPMPYSSQRRSTSSFTASSISISGGHGRAPSSGSFARRVDPELAADELPLGRVVEVVERPVGDHDVALRIDVRADVEEDLLVVVHVHVGVDDDDRLRQREHPEAPDRVHHLARVAGERLADRDDHAVVEGAGDREVVVDDLGHGHADGRQEDPLGRLPEPRVLLRRLADDDRRVDRVAPHRHRLDVEDRERLGRRVVAGVVAERALEAELVLLDVALEHDLRVRRHLEVVARRTWTISTGRPRKKPASISSPMCFGSGALAEYAVTGSSPSATATGMRPSVASQSARPSLWICQCMKVVRRSTTCIRYMPRLRVPVRGSRVITAGRVMNGAGSPGQQRCTGSRPRSTSSPRRTTSWHGPLRTDFGPEPAIDFSFCRPRTLSIRPCGRLQLEHVGDPLGEVVESLDAERERHPPLGAELVDQERVARALRVLEQERGAAGLHRPVDDLGDLEVGVDLGGRRERARPRARATRSIRAGRPEGPSDGG